MNRNILEPNERFDLLKELRRINKNYVLKNTVSSVYRQKNLLTDEVDVFLNEVSLSDLIAIKIEQVLSLTKGKIYPILLSDIFKLVKLGYIKYSKSNNKKGIYQHVLNASYRIDNNKKEKNSEEK